MTCCQDFDDCGYIGPAPEYGPNDANVGDAYMVVDAYACSGWEGSGASWTELEWKRISFCPFCGVKL